MNNVAKPLDVIRAQMMSPAVQDQLQRALPPHVNPQRFTRIALTVIGQNPDLLKADRASLFQSVMGAAQLGLLPENVMGEAYILPFKGKAQLLVGYKGLLKLARQSGLITSIYADVAHENDTEAELILGSTAGVKHRPLLRGDRGDPLFVYAVAQFKDGSQQLAWMTIDEVERIRKGSPGANSPAWKGHWGQMAIKTCLRRLLKTLPLSTEAAMAVAADEAAEERGELYGITPDGLIAHDPPPVKPTGAKKASGSSAMDALAAEAEDAQPEGEWQGGNQGEMQDDL